MKNIYLVLILIIAGCTGNVAKDTNKNLMGDEYKQRSLSTVFNRPDGPTKVEFDDSGKFIKISCKATAPIASHNSSSIEQAVHVATLRAKRNLSEFIGGQLNSSRSLVVLSKTLQKSQENTANGINAETIVDDQEIPNEYNTKEDLNNQNNQHIAETVRESIKSNSTAILRGVMVVNEQIDASGGVVEVQISADRKSIKAAKDLQNLMN